MKRGLGLAMLMLIATFAWAAVPAAPARADPGDGKAGDASTVPITTGSPSSSSHAGSSPFEPPDANDSTFVVDEAPGLDTGCTFRSGGPLIFNVSVDRFPGDRDKLRANGLISETAVLRMPAWDVDFFGGNGFNPERDRLFFNGNVVPTEFLTGDNEIWKLNAFNIPIEWVIFPTDPEDGNTLTPAVNTIRIDIDTANTDEFWCTAIDWAALSIKVVRPVLGVHGILSTGAVWNSVWLPGLWLNLGVPVATLDMGPLDSIQDNAGEIEAKVNGLKNRWGIDKVNIVAHSKGGLDSREYAETHDTVWRLAQIGTPNAGSPLADAVQAGLIALVGVVPTAILDTLAGPAAVQLTTAYMALYNLTHSFNADTSYVSLAGDYRFGGLGSILDGILSAFYGGPSDTIVPVWSVHALSYAAHLIYTSTGANKQAQHTSQNSSIDIYNRLKGFLTAVDPGTGSPQSLSSQPAGPAVIQGNPGITPAATIADTIGQGQTNTHALLIDSAVPIAFTLYHGTGDLDLTLVSPSGTRINPAVAATDPDIEFEQFGDVDGFRFEAYGISNPEVGQWTLEVSGASVVNPSGEEPYILTAWLTETPIQLEAETDQTSYQSGDAIIIRATLTNGGAAITGAAVTTKVVLPDESFALVSLVDDGTGDDVASGDGIYSGRFANTVEPGLYRLLVTANGQPPLPFTREALLIAPVSSSASRFTGTFSDSGNDTDGDSLFNELVIDVGLNITEPANYRVLAVLTDGTGATIASTSAQSSLGTGAHTLSLRFDGSLIFAHGVDGPYNLSLVRLAEDDGFAVLPIDELLNAHATAGYDHRQFQRPSIFIPGTGSDQGIDTDGNGLFDLLETNLNVDLVNADFYNWSARLVDVNGTELGFTAGSGFLGDGPNSITFSFDGEAIGENGVDGPYFLNDLLIFSSSDSRVVFQAYSTLPYRAAQFEGFVSPDVTPPASSVLGMARRFARTPAPVAFEAADPPGQGGVPASGVAYLELWYRYGRTWRSNGAWSQYNGQFTTSPISFAPPSGTGFYDLYTIAVDNAGNREEPPGVPDARYFCVVWSGRDTCVAVPWLLRR